jgi:hypothetical protein
MTFLQSRKSAFLKFQGFENAMKTALSFWVTIFCVRDGSGKLVAKEL